MMGGPALQFALPKFHYWTPADKSLRNHGFQGNHYAALKWITQQERLFHQSSHWNHGRLTPLQMGQLMRISLNIFNTSCWVKLFISLYGISIVAEVSKLLIHDSMWIKDTCLITGLMCNHYFAYVTVRIAISKCRYCGYRKL